MAGPPNLTFGQVPTAGQWNEFFNKKQDSLGYTPLNQAGGSMNGKLRALASSTAFAGFSLLPGVQPSAPSDGDLWITSSGFFVRANGTTISIPSSFATAAQGSKADTALQPANIGSSVQGYNATLASISGLSLTAGDILYAINTNTVVNLPVGAIGQVLSVSGSSTPFWSTPNSGNVIGPAYAVDGEIARFNGTTGKIVKSSPAVDVRNFLNVPPYVATRTNLRALDTTKDALAFVMESDREGLFTWLGSDISSHAVLQIVTSSTINVSTNTVSLLSVTSTSINSSTDIITANGHGFVNDNEVTVTTSVNGLLAGDIYYIANATTNTFQLRSALPSGPIFDLTGTTNVTVIARHNLHVGDAVISTTSVNGLSTNTLYYVIGVDFNSFKLATTYANALAGTAFVLTGTTNFTLKHIADPLQERIVLQSGSPLDGSGGAWINTDAIGTGSFSINQSPQPRIHRIADRVFIDNGINFNGGFHIAGSSVNGLDPLADALHAWGPRDASLYVDSSVASMAIVGHSQSSKYAGWPASPGSIPSTIGVSGFAINDRANGQAWGGYFDAVRMQGADFTVGLEVTIANFGNQATPTPFSVKSGGASGGVGLWLASGAGLDLVYSQAGNVKDASAGIAIVSSYANNAAKFRVGIVIANGSLTDRLGSGSGIFEAMSMPDRHQISWYRASDGAQSGFIWCDTTTTGVANGITIDALGITVTGRVHTTGLHTGNADGTNGAKIQGRGGNNAISFNWNGTNIQIYVDNTLVKSI